MEWYRSPEWSLVEQEHFERKLRRARPENRTQYLRIKGLALDKAGHADPARTLWIRAVVEAGRDAFLQSAPLEHLGRSVMEEDPAAAEAYFRRLLEINPSLDNTSGQAEVLLAELLLRHGGAERAEEAAAFLADYEDRDSAMFPSEQFAHAVARARLSEAVGEPEAAAEWAMHALDLAQLDSPLDNAPGLAVGRLDDELELWLRAHAGRVAPDHACS
jgi:tetratricopeptide (TPR) repeat protein